MNKKENQNDEEKNPLSIDYEDNEKDFDGFLKFIHKHTNQQKKYTAQEIEFMGEKLVKEKTKKEKRQDKQKLKLIDYIVEKQKNTFYDKEDLINYSYHDIIILHKQVKHDNRSAFRKFIELFF